MFSCLVLHHRVDLNLQQNRDDLKSEVRLGPVLSGGSMQGCVSLAVLEVLVIVFTHLIQHDHEQIHYV